MKDPCLPDVHDIDTAHAPFCLAERGPRVESDEVHRLQIVFVTAFAPYLRHSVSPN